MPAFLIDLLVILLGLVGIGIVIGALRCRKDIQAAYARLTSLGSLVIETACGPIEYACQGKGYPVLVVHGAMGGFDQGLWLANSFDVPREHQVISISRFGYLGSPLPAGANLDRQADAFAELLDTLGIQQVAVFGVSAGSTSAIRFVARHPERVSALVLLGPDAPGKVQMALPPRFFFDTLLRHDFVYWAMVTLFAKQMQTAIGLVPRGYPLTRELAARVKLIQMGDLPVSQRIDGLIFETYTCADDFNASVTPVSPYPLNKIETPVLVINAADDPISIPENVRRLAEQMPNARIFGVPDGGHFLFGHMEETKAEITQFLHRYAPEPQQVSYE